MIFVRNNHKVNNKKIKGSTCNILPTLLKVHKIIEITL